MSTIRYGSRVQCFRQIGGDGLRLVRHQQPELHRTHPVWLGMRLEKQDIDARFTADDGGALNGEIVPFKDGMRQGQVWGGTYRGAVSLYFAPGEGFGFGSRNGLRRAIP